MWLLGAPKDLHSLSSVITLDVSNILELLMRCAKEAKVVFCLSFLFAQGDWWRRLAAYIHCITSKWFWILSDLPISFYESAMCVYTKLQKLWWPMVRNTVMWCRRLHRLLLKWCIFCFFNWSASPTLASLMDLVALCEYNYICICQLLVVSLPQQEKLFFGCVGWLLCGTQHWFIRQ